MYVNLESAYHDDFSEALRRMVPQRGLIPKNWSYMADFITMQLTFAKPINGKMPTRRGEELRLFQDECEWRYVPTLPEDMKSFILNPNPAELKAYNKALRLKENKNSWLRFSLDDICYLIVPDEKAANNLTSFIREKIKPKLTEDETYKLVRKIEISEYFGKNYV